MHNDNLNNKSVLTQDEFPIDLTTGTNGHLGSTLIGSDRREGILERLDEACQRFKEQTAIEWNDQQVSYSALDGMANRLANCLIANQLSKGSLIAVILDDRLELIATLIGILRAGCVFVPLDPDSPEERLRKIVAELSPDCFIIQDKFSNLVTQIYGNNKKLSKIINLSDNSKSNSFDENLICINQSLMDFSTERSFVPVNSEEMCYIYYTSGSTGTPKGIAGRLKGIFHFINWEIETFNITPGWRFSQFTRPTFDAFLRDVFVPLCVGGTVCIPPEKVTMMGTRQLIEWIDSKKINLIHCVPSLFGVIASMDLDSQKLKSLKYILMAGEILPISDVKKWMEVYGSRIKLINLYGATETTLVKFYHQVQPSDLERGFIPIGKPMKGARAVVLDQYGNLCPRGVFGELYIRTPYQTLGYYNKPELTKEVFVSNPFSENSDDLIYKTGDLARLLNDGNFQLRGRKDNQVKIRGIRIELGEIENQLRNHNLVRSAVVLAREDVPGDKRLVAYLVPEHSEHELSLTQLRSFLKEKLPDYMVPSTFVMLDALPLTPNGKVNRRALPAPNQVRQEAEETFVAPRDDFELQLTGIWEQVLGIQPIGIRDNLFELGAHSLLVARLSDQIEKAFNKNLPLATIFQSPTVEQLASILRQEDSSATYSSVTAIQPKGAKPPLFLCEGVSIYSPLIPYLGPEQPLYGLVGPIEQTTPSSSNWVEELVTQYIQEMRTVQPEGPYFLGGLSFGGIIAYEMAQQLMAQGQKVALLALLDTYLIDAKRPLPIHERIRYHLRQTLKLGPAYVLKQVQQKSQKLKEKVMRIYGKFYLEQGNTAPHALEYFARREISDQAHRDYVPQVYPGRVILFKATDRAEAATFYFDPDLGWGKLAAGGLDIYEVPGNHLSLLKEPHVRVLGEKLRDCLDKEQVADGTDQKHQLRDTSSPSS